MAQRTRTSSGGRSAKGRAAYIAVAAFLLGLAAGGVQRGLGASRDHATQPRPASRTSTAVQTEDQSDAAPAGFARTQAGAVAAAAAFVTTGQLLLDVDPLAAEGVVREMAAARTADAQVTETLTKLAAARDALAAGTGRIRYPQSVLAWRVDSFSQRRARVAIWGVGVLSRAEIAPPQASWAVSTLDLVWERGDWRLLSERIVPGPAPMLDDSAPPATSDQLESALEGFADFRGAP